MKKKVLIVLENETFPFDRRVRSEAYALKDNGYDVTVLCPRKESLARGHEVMDGIHVYRHPTTDAADGEHSYLIEYFLALFWEFLYAGWIFVSRGFHVIHACNPPDDIFLIALPFKLLGIKYIFDHHDVSPELYLSKFNKKDFLYRIQLSLERLTFRFSDVVLSTNGSYRDLALTRGGCDPENVFIVRNGPNLDTFQAVPPNPALKYGKTHLVGYVGSIAGQEGLDILLDVALYVKNTGRDDVHFTCIGRGPALPGLRKMVHDYRLEDMVDFTGRIPEAEMLEILSTSDVCVNPDRPCAMNDVSTMIKIMEYMALGKPIVQFDLKEGRFSAGDASLYADNENRVGDFAAKLLWLLDHPAERQRMGEFGRKRVETELAWKFSVVSLLRAYERALGKRMKTRSLGLSADSERPNT
jgi:glycosyltransferase involved in cell wall biosynthesis